MSRRPYKQPVSRTGWWLAQPRYIRYMMREISSLFIGGYALVMIVGLYRMSQGPHEYAAFYEALMGPAGVTYAVVTLLFAAYHTYTWFLVTPKAMPLVLAGKRVPGLVIIGAHWLGFLVASAALWALMTAGRY